MKKIMSILTLAVALFLTACSQQEKATQTSSKQTSASSQTVTSASEEQKEGVVHRWQLSWTGRGKYDPLGGDGSKRHVYGARC